MDTVIPPAILRREYLMKVVGNALVGEFREPARAPGRSHLVTFP
jgi:hypothetical protein